MLYALCGFITIEPNKSWQGEVVLESSPPLSIFVITSLCNHSCLLMSSLQGSCLSLPMSHFVYERVGFHCFWLLLGLHPKWSLSNILYYCDPLYPLYAQLFVFALTAMAPVVRFEPNNTKLLEENPKLLAKVEAVG